MQALLRSHRAGLLRVRPRRARAPGPGGPAPGAAGPVPGVPPDQDAPGVLPRRVPGEPRVPERPRGLRAICHGVDVVRCRKNARPTQPCPCPSSAPSTPCSPPGTGTWRTSPTWSCTGTTGRPCSGSSPTWAGAGSASPRPRTCWRRARRPGPTSSGPWTPRRTWSHGAWPRPWRSWRTPGRRGRSTWPSSRSTPSSGCGPGTRTWSTPCAPATTSWTGRAASGARP